MTVRVAINGFGRIGRTVFRFAWEDPRIEVVHINDLTSPEMLAYLLEHDSVQGGWKSVSAAEGALVIDGKHIPITAERNPENLPWSERNVDVVMEATGVFRTKEAASAHLRAGARKVIISAPGKSVDGTFVFGVNHEEYDPASHDVISNASCTTNCLGPALKVLHQNFGVVQGSMTTIHSYTMDQNLLDAPHRGGNFRRSRAAAVNMVPTTTGAATAIGLVLPELAGRIEGFAVRVPTPTGSLVDLKVKLEKSVTAETINAALEEASQGQLHGVLDATYDELVSSDIVGNHHSSIADLSMTSVQGDHYASLLLWYDNEAGFSARMIDITAYVGSLL